MDKEKQSIDINQNDITSSSSNEDPMTLTQSHFEIHLQQQNKERRRSSINSIHKNTVEFFRKSLTGDNVSYNEKNDVEYSVHHIYGDLNSEEIKLQRSATRRSIINEIENKIEDNDDQIDAIDELAIPETSIILVQQHGKDFDEIDPELVTFTENDPDNPRNWSTATKIYLIGFVSLYALVAPMSSSMVSPAVPEIAKEFNITSPVIKAMVVSIQILSWAIGPLIIAPLSEHDIIGRKLVLDVTCWISLIFNIGCSVSQNTAQLMICRFFCGLFGANAMSICAGNIADLVDPNYRNMALAGYSLAPLLGPVIAPLISGFIVDHKPWRWSFYILCAFNGFVALTATFLFKETYAPTILLRRAKKLRKTTGNDNLHTIYEITDNETFISKVWICMCRPIKILFFHPMIVALGSFMAFTYSFMYLMITTFPEVFGNQYGFKTKGKIGLMYIPLGIGFLLGVFIWTFSIDKVYSYLTKKNKNVAKPEFRLPCLLASAIFIPLGLIIFGWSVQYKLHWVLPSLGSILFGFGLVAVFQTIQNYFIDMNTRLAASSVAAGAMFRSVFGFFLPLIASKLYGRFGYGWGNTLCAFIAIVLGIPFPTFCFFYGERIRNWANKRFEMEQLKRDQKNLEKMKRKNNDLA
ncbi:unnamed protein product [Candida verbasci]|uniref:Major facilitator superfamily (MFS) profile domain-containing protein n=1 Tax=Candida verbasci TaxID=1227364 RepID=A0A9W4TXE3_9ASCO|nr:unnamed protein product [Candida verbasci]